MKKFLFLIMGLLVFSTQAVVQAQSNVIDEVVWVIGDDAILLSDVEAMREEMVNDDIHLPGDPYCIIPEQLALQKLYLHQAVLDSIDVPDSEVYQRVEYYIGRYITLAGSQEKFEEYLLQSKGTLNDYREELRVHFKEQLTVSQMQRKLVEKVKVTPSEVRTFFNRIPQDSLPYMSTTVEVEIITVEPTPAIEEVDEIKRKLREYTELVTSGQRDFSTLARLYSEDKGSAIRGGDMGFMGKSDLIPEFAAAAYDLNDPKRVSRIVETEYGFHIIQLIEKKGNRINVRHILLKAYISPEELQAAVARLDSMRNDIVADKITFELAASYASYDKDTRNNKGLMVNKNETGDISNDTDRTGTSHFEMNELPAEIAKVISTMKVGEISKPFTMINSKQKQIAAIVKLKSRIDGHKANLVDDFQALQSLVISEKQNRILDKWIDQKIKETYIRINDNWKNCEFGRTGWIQK